MKKIALLVLIVLVSSYAPVKVSAFSNNEASASQLMICGTVDAYAVTVYLQNLGFTVTTTPVQADPTTWTCEATKDGYRWSCSVFTDEPGDNIVGHENIII